MRCVIALLFFTVAFAPQSVSLKLDADGAQVIAVVAHGGVIVADSTDCDDDYRNSHAATEVLPVDISQILGQLIRLPESSPTNQLIDTRLPLYELYTVLRI